MKQERDAIAPRRQLTSEAKAIKLLIVCLLDGHFINGFIYYIFWCKELQMVQGPVHSWRPDDPPTRSKRTKSNGVRDRRVTSK